MLVKQNAAIAHAWAQKSGKEREHIDMVEKAQEFKKGAKTFS